MSTPVTTLIAYIHGELTTNVVSPSAARLRRLLGPSLTSYIPSIGPVIGAGRRAEAYRLWVSLVRSGAPWDHKPHLSSTYGNWSEDATHRREYFFDIWSNLHYGYIGKSVGFSQWELLNGAGAAQVADGTNPPGYWGRRTERIGDADFLAAFDDPKDQAAIRVGINLWNTHGVGVAQSTILATVRRQARSLSTRPMTAGAATP
jgi:hypothetical protein